MSDIPAKVRHKVYMGDLAFGDVYRIRGNGVNVTYSTDSKGDNMKMRVYTSTDPFASAQSDGSNWTQIRDTAASADGDAVDEAVAADVRSIICEVYQIESGHDRDENPGELWVMHDNVRGVDSGREANSGWHPKQQSSPAVPQA